MIASIGCAIHCAAMPLVLAYLPSLGLGWLASEGFHQWMAGICFVLAASAFIPGWRKHGSFVPAVWGACGLVLLTTAAFGLEDGCCTSCTTTTCASTTTTCTSVGQAAGVGDLVGAGDFTGVGNLAGPEDECEFCQAAEVEQPVADSPVFASISPFVTPLGGLLLVVGHILNHLKSCSCQGNSCCLSDQAEA